MHHPLICKYYINKLILACGGTDNTTFNFSKDKGAIIIGIEK